MISGVRASSMRMLSTSSTIAKGCSRWTQCLERGGHVVAQVVEAELGVGPVDDVGRVRSWRRRRVLAGLDHADGDAERVVDRAHPLGVAAGEVVVDGDHVDAVAGERVQEHGERRGQRLALAGPHLGDRPVVQDHAADQLDVEVALAERPPRRLAAERERLREQVVERLAALARARGARRRRSRISASSSSSISGSKRLIASTRRSYSLNWRPSPRRRARSISPLATGSEGTDRPPGSRPTPCPGAGSLRTAASRSACGASRDGA